MSTNPVNMKGSAGSDVPVEAKGKSSSQEAQFKNREVAHDASSRKITRSQSEGDLVKLSNRDVKRLKDYQVRPLELSDDEMPRLKKATSGN